MAALSSHTRYFIASPSEEGCILGGGRKVNGFTQGLARFEVGQTLGGYQHRFAAARIAARAFRAVVDGEAAKPTNFDALALHQGIDDGILQGFDSLLGIALH